MVTKQRVQRAFHSKSKDSMTLDLECGHSVRIEEWSLVGGEGPFDITSIYCEGCFDSPLERDLVEAFTVNVIELFADEEADAPYRLEMLQRFASLILHRLGNRVAKEAEQRDPIFRAKIMAIVREATGVKG